MDQYETAVYETTLPHGKYLVEAIQPNIFHCIYTRREETARVSYLDITAEPETEMQVQEDEKYIRLTAGTMQEGGTAHMALELSPDQNDMPSLRLTIDKSDGRFRWEDRDGNLLLQENGKELIEIPFVKYIMPEDGAAIRREKTIDGERNFAENLQPVTDHMCYRAKLRFTFQDDEKILGFGQGEDGIYDYRGHVQYLYQHNMRIPMPFMVSTGNYAVLIDCGCLMTFQDNGNECCLIMDAVEQLDYYFICGKGMDDLVAGFRKLTGKAAMLPKWAFGFVQSKEAYHTQEEFLDVAERFRKDGLPIDCLVQDWNTWENGAWGSKKVDKERYPDISAMNEKIHGLHMHSMISVWPTVSEGTDDYREMRQNDGYLLYDNTTYNAFLEGAGKLYWKQLEEELYRGGYDAWWCDSTEPFSGPDWNGSEKRDEGERFRLVGEEHKKYLDPDRANLYAVFHAKWIYVNQRKANETKRVLNLTRSGYPSIQKYGTVLWSGDICASWETLRKQIAEGISMGISGMPYWTNDAGGFFVVHENWQGRGCFANTDPTMKWFWRGDFEKGVDDLGYRELYVRWMQYSVFLPMFRSHGTDTPREIWHYGKPGEPFYDALEKAMRLRYRLMPYIYSAAGMVWLNDDTMLRGLVFDHPQDETACGISDEYLFGRSLLVCPVTEAMYYGRDSEPLNRDKIRNCYLPAGNDWYDFFTGEKYAGGTWVARYTPLCEMPVFVKAGSIIPMEQKLLYAQEEVDTPLELHIYGGADAEYLYYEDAGDGYAYEDGDYQVIRMQWDDAERRLTIGPACRRYPQSILGRKCVAVYEGIRKEFSYQGEQIVIRL